MGITSPYPTSSIKFIYSQNDVGMQFKVKLEDFFQILTPFGTGAQYGQSKSKQKLKSLDFYHHSIKVHTQEAQNLHQLKSPLSDPTSQNFQKLYFMK